jgi:hypothetical protein
MKLTVVLGLSLVLLTSCLWVHNMIAYVKIDHSHYRELYAEKSDPDIQLKTNGYYYGYDQWLPSPGTTRQTPQDRMLPIILYKNRVAARHFYWDVDTTLEDIADIHKSFTDWLNAWDTVHEGYYQKSNKGWGHYRITSDSTISIRWLDGDVCCSIWIYEGKIINDSTFVITSFSIPDSPWEDTSENILYHFRYYPNRPDSTNPTLDW